MLPRMHLAVHNLTGTSIREATYVLMSHNINHALRSVVHGLHCYISDALQHATLVGSRSSKAVM
jgi:hypothetical protein